jgi:ABC-2 type transport system permease protein
MIRLISAEALKLRTTRTAWLLALGTLALIIAAVAATSATASRAAGPSPVRAELALAGLAQTAALLAGALAVTGEYRHKTMTQAVLAAPRRTPLLAAKLAVLAAAGLAFGLVATAAAVATALPVLAARHIPGHVTAASLAGIIAGGGVATALAAALGVGVGAVIRNQVGAVVAVLGLLYVAEPLLGFTPRLGRDVQTYGLGGLASGTTSTAGFPAGAHLLGPVPAGLVLAAYALAALLAGAGVLRSRDITA